MNLRSSLLVALALLASCSSPPSGKTATPAKEADLRAVHDFVQDFYSWYVPLAAKSSSGPGSDLALTTRPSAFDPLLARELKEDSDAQAKVPADIVGLDFDPFLASQDPCERYEVVSVDQKTENYLVGVHGVGGCEKHDAADVIAEVASTKGALSFVNFHYPGLNNEDLRTTLKKLREDRK